MKSDLRRALVTALLALSTFATLAGAFAVVAPEGSVQAPMQVPLPQVGDRGTYAWGVDYAGTGPTFDFEWIGKQGFAGPEGLVIGEAVQVNGIHLVEWSPQGSSLMPRDRASRYFFSGDRMVGYESGEADDNATLLEGTATLGQVGAETYLQRQRTFGVAEAHCLFRSPLQGKGPLPTHPVWLDQSCDLGAATMDGPAMAWTSLGMESVAGLASLHLHGEVPGRLHGVPSLDVWLVDGLPYPLRVTWTGEASGSLELLAFTGGERGPADVAVGYSHNVTMGPPSPEFALRTSSFLDDRDVPHPFGLSEALGAAAQDPTASAFRDFLAAEPLAYIYYAQDISFGDHRGWYAEFRGERSAFALEVGKGPLVPDVLGAILLPPVGAPVDYPVTVSGNLLPGIREGTVHPDAIPVEVPTVAGLLRLAEAMGVPPAPPGPAETRPTWGFLVYCADRSQLVLTPLSSWPTASASEPCNASVFAWAGSFAESRAADRVSAQGEPTLHWSRNVVVTVDGAAWSVQEDSAFSFVAWSQPPVNVTLDQPEARSRGVRPSGPGLPPGEVAAGAGGLAAVVAAAYWFWPHIKSGLGTLFSRIQRPDILRNEKRALLMETISASPGIRFRELARTTQMHNGVLVHHLRKLEEAELVRQVRHPRYTAYVAAGAAVPLAHPVLHGESVSRVMELIKADPGISQTEVARRAGLTATTVNYHLRRLAGAKLITIEKHGRTLRILPAGPTS